MNDNYDYYCRKLHAYLARVRRNNSTVLISQNSTGKLYTKNLWTIEEINWYTLARSELDELEKTLGIDWRARFEKMRRFANP